MDAFQYAMAIKKVESFKTIKAHDEYARELVTQLNDLNPNTWGGIRPSADVPTATYRHLYKVLTKVISNHTGASGLAGFIISAASTIEDELVGRYKEGDTTYDNLIDTFEFSEVVRFSWIDRKIANVLAPIIMDKPLPFTIDYYFSPGDGYSSLGYLPMFDNITSAGLCLELEDIKRALPSGTTYTFIELLLDDAYKDTRTGDHSNAIDTGMHHLNTVVETFKQKLVAKKCKP